MLKALAALAGTTPRYKLTAGEEAVGIITHVKGISSFVYGAGSTAVHGVAPAEDDTVSNDSNDRWLASKVVCKTGSAWIYAALGETLTIQVTPE